MEKLPTQMQNLFKKKHKIHNFFNWNSVKLALIVGPGLGVPNVGQFESMKS